MTPRYNPAMAIHPTPGTAPTGPDELLSVSALNRVARQTLEARFPLLWVAGEISNLTRAPSGHLYFTLKDEAAQVRCTMWRNRAQLLPFQPTNGMQVEIRAQVTLYEARGDFQLSVESVRRGGLGTLFEAFLRLKEKLAAEGLFDPAGKRPVPLYPRGIGIVTSPQAAALQDVLATLARRAPHLPVVLYPAPVQGADAPGRLLEAVGQAGRRAATDGVDVLLLVRGGGSLEDLWAFNNEALARGLKTCPIPVVCGVGHESDVSIADFAADLRAATPTAAAELVTSGFHGVHQHLAMAGRRLGHALERRLGFLGQRLDRAALRLAHPREQLARAATHLEHLAHRLKRASQPPLNRPTARLEALAARLTAARPSTAGAAHRLAEGARRLQTSAGGLLAQRQHRIQGLAAHLEHLNPEAILARGYSITRDTQGQILRDCAHIPLGSGIRVQLARGRLKATVHAREDDPPAAPGIVIPPSAV